MKDMTPASSRCRENLKSCFGENVLKAFFVSRRGHSCLRFLSFTHIARKANADLSAGKSSFRLTRISRKLI